MGIVYRKRKTLAPGTWVNLSKSGPSLSHQVGRLTLNSRGRATYRIAPGWSFRMGKQTTGVLGLLMVAGSLIMLGLWLCWVLVRVGWLLVWLPTVWTWRLAMVGVRRGLESRSSSRSGAPPRA